METWKGPLERSVAIKRDLSFEERTTGVLSHAAFLLLFKEWGSSKKRDSMMTLYLSTTVLLVILGVVSGHKAKNVKNGIVEVVDNVVSVERCLDKHVFPEGPWISSAKDIHIEPISLLLVEENNETIGHGAVHSSAANNRKEDCLRLLTAKLRTKWRRWRQAEIIFQPGDQFINKDGKFVMVPSGTWIKTARFIHSEPLNQERSLWFLKAQLLSAGQYNWRDAVTIFQRGDEFVNDDGSFVLVVQNNAASMERFKWQTMTKQQSSRRMDGDDVSCLNLWDCILLCMPPFSLVWGDSIKRRLLNSQCRLESTQTELCRTIQALKELMIAHEKERVTLQRKLCKVEKENGKLERGKRKAVARQVSRTLQEQFQSCFSNTMLGGGAKKEH